LMTGPVRYIFGGLFIAAQAVAGEADVLKAEASCQEDVCRFEVTIQHADEGWKHYANRFEVLTLEGKVLGTRVLVHPHVNEQPFTRALSGVSVPRSQAQVRIRAGDLVHEFGGQELVIELPR